VSRISQAAASVIAGCAASGGVVLVVAGAGKLYRGVRGLDDMTAIRTALRMPRRQWRLFALAAGVVECAVGVVVCSGRSGVPGGVALACLGAVFCALLGYVRVKKVPGDCGCIRWRPSSSGAGPAGVPPWQAIARGGMLLGAGAAYAGVSAGTAGAPRQSWWFTGGLAAGLAVLALLSLPSLTRTPRCRRPLWRQTSATLRALASHDAFAAMAGSAGPFGPVVRYRRTGCTDEFWFTMPAGEGSRAAVFQVRRAAHGTRLAVHTSLRDVAAPDANWPARAITLADAGRGYEVSRRP
jgi:hypothetical protein